MSNIALIYFSGSGHTQLQAEAIAAGARTVPNTTVDLLRITGSQIKEGRWADDAFAEKLQAADAIVYGSPTYMGGPAAQFKAFADWTGGVWYKQGWKDKLAGGFTHSGSPSGDKASTIQYFMTLAGQHSQIWVSTGVHASRVTGDGLDLNNVGGFTGLMGAGGAPYGQPAQITEGDRRTAEAYGKRLAELTARFRK